MMDDTTNNFHISMLHVSCSLCFRLGGDLATAIETITQDYTIGFGSFVDKELSPYISLISEENCQQAHKKCPPPYR